ncbi:lactaldehyde reductase [Actinotalea sp. K2]|uniref:lactaldehyde reductase n=1 Tax=Actinotalea sp. K2 TaxID=2939438 RepID=UPI002017B009|nr:lactaldehyde reductase [Actinotalea sp. K2]MCL3859441.1 lactaldehyde reductase [Actinotalea sp. K2]
MVHRMILNQTAYFGRGAVANVPLEITTKGYRKALVVTDAVLVANGVAARVTSRLDEAGIDYELFDGVMPNPTIEAVQQGVKAFQAAEADCLVAIGGGSPQDTCKAVGIIIANPEFADVRSLEGVAATTRPSVPIIAVPTTAGTAAEVTINYVITDVQNRRKFVCVDPHDIPLVAVVDADLMDGMPRSLCVATGMDALTHALEGYTTLGAWELTDALHLTAIEMIASALPSAARGEADGVERMALGQYMAGMGFSNVGLGLVHAMAHPLGAFYDTPHGIANGVLLPHVMAFNATHTGEKLRAVARAMGVAGVGGLTLDEAREAAVRAVAELAARLDVPAQLREIGVREVDLPALAQAAHDDVCAGGNPRPATVEEILALYRTAY